MIRPAYDTDLTDAQWEILKPLIPAPKSGGRPRSLDIREVLNAIFYLLSNGIKWRAMPHDLPNWQSVYTYFRDWEADNTWRKINETLRTEVRLAAGRNAKPSAGSVDSQSVKTVSGGEEIGFDGGKKVKGRKRTISSIRWGYCWGYASIVLGALTMQGCSCWQPFGLICGGV